MNDGYCTCMCESKRPCPRHPKPLFEVGKTYRTNKGLHVRITSVTGKGTLSGHDGTLAPWAVRQPVEGTFIDENRPAHWCAGGEFVRPGYGHDLDLVPVALDDEPVVNADIPHADLIRAVLDGKVVQCRDIKFRGEPPTVPGFQYVECFDATSDYTGLPRTEQYLRQAMLDLLVNSAPDYEFRLKPEPIVRWHPVWKGGHTGFGFTGKASLLRDAQQNEYEPDFKCLRLELDPDTLDVISARTEAP